VWSRLSLGDQEAVLVLRGDVLRSPVISGFLDQAQGRTGDLACGTVAADGRGAVVLVRPGCAEPGAWLDRLSWSASGDVAAEDDCIECPGSLDCLPDLPAFHRANRDLVAGRFEGLGVAGRSVALGLTAGRGGSVPARILKQGVAYVGAHSRIHPEAELLGEVVIGDAVVVDRAATIRDSVILPHTYVGELVEVRNAIVSGNDLIRVDTGARLRIRPTHGAGSRGWTVCSVWLCSSCPCRCGRSQLLPPRCPGRGRCSCAASSSATARRCPPRAPATSGLSRAPGIPPSRSCGRCPA
jgi:hypothetical protein